MRRLFRLRDDVTIPGRWHLGERRLLPSDLGDFEWQIFTRLHKNGRQGSFGARRVGANAGFGAFEAGAAGARQEGAR